MKIKINHAVQGSVLLVTMCTSGVIILALGSYLWLVSSHNLSAMRSLAWNSALTVAEAGAEEALTQVQYNDINHLSANTWINLNNGWYYKKRYVDSVSYYEVVVKKVDPPVIISTATVPAPVSTLAPTSTFGLILGTATPSTSVVKRRIRVNTTRRPRFLGAMVANQYVNLNGNGISTDGFDSSDPLYSTLGKYDTGNVGKHKASGDVASNSTGANAIDLGNATIRGHVSTGPGGVANSNNALVGDMDWVKTHVKGIESGWITDDANFDIITVSTPLAPSGWSTGYNSSVLGTNILGFAGQSTYYKLSAFTGKVIVLGDVTLWVTDTVTFGAKDSIYVTPGSNLKVYVGTESGPPVLATLGGIGNDSYASSFQYYGLPSNTALTFQANAAFTGTIYAPQADFKLNGGGSDDIDFIGACVVKTGTMGGHFKFHFDEALERTLWLGYVATGWNELDPNAPIN